MQSENFRDVWTDPACAEKWSEDPTSGNPSRAEHLDLLMALLVDLYDPNKTILDVGLGSGLVEAMIFERIPNAHVVGVDSSEAMVSLARERLKTFESQYEVAFHDLTKLDDGITLLHQPFQIAFSVQTIHNIPDEHKVEALQFVHRVLEPGGWFFLIDRFAVTQPHLFDAYRGAWSRQNRIYNSNVNEQDTFEAHLDYVASNGDLPATVEQHLDWMRGIGFAAECLHLYANRGFIVGRKAT